MSECYCDYDPATIYKASRPTARKPHVCEECGRQIQPGERYESVFGVWENKGNTYHTCRHCLALRDYVQAHVPCFCWAHGSTIEDAMETARSFAHEAPGFLFGAYRRQVQIHRAKLALGGKP